MNYLSLGPVPVGEERAHVGEPDYYERAHTECRRHVELIRKKLRPEPKGARLAIRECPHASGTYYEVGIWYDAGNLEAIKYTFKVELDARGSTED